MFRIVSMLLIIAHHYGVNSGLSQVAYEHFISRRALFVFLFSAWGKMGINCFVLITGYYMCKKRATFRRLWKLFFEVLFYNLTIYGLFLAFGIQPFSKTELVRCLFPIDSATSGFVSCFFLFYGLIPFLNRLIEHLEQREHLLLCGLCFVIYTWLGTVSFVRVFYPAMTFTGTNFNYVSWFAVLYLTGAFIRCYPKKLFSRRNLWIATAISCVLLSCLGVVWCTKLLAAGRSVSPYFFLADSNKLLAYLTAVSAFLMFLNIRSGAVPWVNRLGGSTFGVLMIHANSDAMRKWLWVDTFHNAEMFFSPWLIFHAFAVVPIVFFSCFVLDQVRIRYIERPFFRWWDRHEARWGKLARKQVDSFLKRMGA